MQNTMQNTEMRKRPRQSSTYNTKRRKLRAQNVDKSILTRQQAIEADFRSNELMQGLPSHAADEFEQPRLRKCPFAPDTIKWESAIKLGDGYDGCAWKVAFGNEGTFVLKVFWDSQPPQTRNGYFAPQRECQNAAILQMIEAVLEEGPVSLCFEYPETRAQAMSNMLAFALPHRNIQRSPAAESSHVVLSHPPPIRKCYGWLDFDGDLIKRMPYRIKPQPRKYDKPPHSMSPGNSYYAIVYEYIPDDNNTPELIKTLLRFFYLVGFSFTCSPTIENWKGSRLIDGSDIVHPGGVGWNVQYYGSPWVAAALLRPDPILESEGSINNNHVIERTFMMRLD